MTLPTSRQSLSHNVTPAFLGVPQEIRNLIYSYVFNDAHIRVATCGVDCADDSRLETLSSGDGFLLVSRQLYREARPVFRQQVKLSCSYEALRRFRIEKAVKEALVDGKRVYLQRTTVSAENGLDPEDEKELDYSVIEYRSGSITVYPDGEHHIYTYYLEDDEMHEDLEKLKAGCLTLTNMHYPARWYGFVLGKVFNSFEHQPPVNLCRRQRNIGVDQENTFTGSYCMVAITIDHKFRILTRHRTCSGTGTTRRACSYTTSPALPRTMSRKTYEVGSRFSSDGRHG